MPEPRYHPAKLQVLPVFFAAGRRLLRIRQGTRAGWPVTWPGLSVTVPCRAERPAFFDDILFFFCSTFLQLTGGPGLDVSLVFDLGPRVFASGRDLLVFDHYFQSSLAQFPPSVFHCSHQFALRESTPPIHPRPLGRVPGGGSNVWWFPIPRALFFLFSPFSGGTFPSLGALLVPLLWSSRSGVPSRALDRKGVPRGPPHGRRFKVRISLPLSPALGFPQSSVPFFRPCPAGTSKFSGLPRAVLISCLAAYHSGGRRNGDPSPGFLGCASPTRVRGRAGAYDLYSAHRLVQVSVPFGEGFFPGFIPHGFLPCRNLTPHSHHVP